MQPWCCRLSPRGALRCPPSAPRGHENLCAMLCPTLLPSPTSLCHSSFAYCTFAGLYPLAVTTLWFYSLYILWNRRIVEVGKDLWDPQVQPQHVPPCPLPMVCSNPMLWQPGLTQCRALPCDAVRLKNSFSNGGSKKTGILWGESCPRAGREFAAPTPPRV